MRRLGDIFRHGVGCLALFVALVTGLLIGYGLYWFDDALNKPYIDRRTALFYGLQTAQAHCRERTSGRHVDCEHFNLFSIMENKYGWHMVLRSADGRRSDRMWILRRGEYDSTGGSDMDDPDHPPVKGLDY